MVTGTGDGSRAQGRGNDGRVRSRSLRRALATKPRRRLLAGTLLLGLLAAVAVTATVAPSERTLLTVLAPVQQSMSVPLPYLGVLLGAELRASPSVRIMPTLVVAALLAAVVGAVGFVLSVAAVASAAVATVGGDPWRHALALAVGGIVVQVVAQLAGVGLGLLVRPPVVAFLATIVLPLGTWLLLSSAGPLRPAREWLTPFATSTALLSGQADAGTWGREFVVVLIWVVTLNTAGAAYLRRFHHRPRATWPRPATGTNAQARRIPARRPSTEPSNALEPPEPAWMADG